MVTGLKVELTTGQKLWADSKDFEFEDGVLYLYDSGDDDARVILAVPQDHVLCVMSHDNDPDAKDDTVDDPEISEYDKLCIPPDPGPGYRLIDKAVDKRQPGDEIWLLADKKWVQANNDVFDMAKYNHYRRRVTPEPVCKREAFSGGGSPSPRECGVCGEGPCEKPVESQDDWVIQDRVPYRYDYDQCRWRDGDEWLSQQVVPIEYRHGYDGGGSLRLQVRCRRKDLPPIPDTPSVGDTVVISMEANDNWNGCKRTVIGKLENGDCVVSKTGEPFCRTYAPSMLRVVPKPEST